ncbi:hypothetical protein VW23_002560 [Devosia insulae DS-56]|uniref:PepSY domain-containing protein n=1 Tax=Devosia insulae DS-56 TaxID=1116389 RepID=A0A1E5XKS0_9HYPH|nr:hypothetical protein [Devosia insulae]OEO29094.1 hypothetical protein VW23_002560 [Devosia insulae DS-56]
MDSVARFLSLLTIATAAGAGSAQAQSDPLAMAEAHKEQLKIQCQAGVNDACRELDLWTMLRPVPGSDGRRYFVLAEPTPSPDTLGSPNIY